MTEASALNEPLVLLPGMMCDRRLFAPQVARFSTNRLVVVIGPDLHDAIDDMAREVLESAPQQFALAGLSMGGIVAMEVYRQAPNRVARLALLDTNPFADPPERMAMRDEQIERVLSNGLRDVMRDEMKPNYLGDGPKRSDILDLCMQMAVDLGEATFVRQSRALQRRKDQSETLRSVRVPTLVLCGEHDVLCPPSRHRFMHDLVSGSVLKVIPDAGHLPVLEQPHETNNALARWLTAPPVSSICA